jgi:hypothetical protein
LAIATNPTTGALYTYTNSINPGDIIVLWGSGLGAISADSDTVFTSTPHPASGPLQIFIGGIQANILYAGDSGYPGVNQIDVTVPSNVSSGCGVSLIAVSGSGSNLVTSNATALAIGQGGGVCSDPILGYSGTTFSNLNSQTTYRTGFVGLINSVEPGTSGTPQTTNAATADFNKTTGATYTASGSVTSIGSCSISETVTSSGSAGTTTALNYGTVTVTGPNGSATLTPESIAGVGISFAQLSAGFIPSTGGAFTFTGTGGSDVGPFSTTVNFPNPILTWTNQSADATISRAQGVTVTWTGGAAGSYVIISGSSSNSTSGVSASFTCHAPVSAGTFTVPEPVTLTLPAGTGTLSLENTTAFQSFSATGIDIGYGFGATLTSINATYN